MQLSRSVGQHNTACAPSGMLMPFLTKQNSKPSRLSPSVIAELWEQSNGTRGFPGGQRPTVGISGYTLGEADALRCTAGHREDM